MKLLFATALAALAGSALGQSIGVTAKGANTSGATSVTTGSVTTTAGSTVIACAAVFGDDFGATPIQDNKGNSWTALGTELETGTGRQTRCFSSTNLANAGAGHTFTVNLASSTFGNIFVVEVIGADSTPTITVNGELDEDGSPYTLATGISPSTATALIGYLATNAGSGTDSHTWGGSFSSGDKQQEETDADSRITGSIAAAIKSSGGTWNASVTGGGTAAHLWVVSVETAAGGGSAVPVILQQQAANDDEYDQRLVANAR